MTRFKHALVSKKHKENDEKVWWYALPAFNDIRRSGSLVRHKTIHNCHNKGHSYIVPLLLLDKQSDIPYPGDYRERASYQEGDFVKFILENVTEDSFGTCDLRLSDHWLHKYYIARTGVDGDVNINIFPSKSSGRYWLCLGEKSNGEFVSVKNWAYSLF